MRTLLVVGLVLFILGLLAGVFYPLRVVLWSGEPLTSVERPAGGVMQFSQRVTLGPAMNPLRANLTVSYLQAGAFSDLDATVTLRSPGGQTVWTRPLRVDDSEGGAGWTESSMPVQRFSVREEGRYEVEVRLVQAYGGQFRDVSLELRRNVAVVDWKIMGGIVGVGLVGLLLTLVAEGIRKARKTRIDLQGAGQDRPRGPA